MKQPLCFRGPVRGGDFSRCGNPPPPSRRCPNALWQSPTLAGGRGRLRVRRSLNPKSGTGISGRGRGTGEGLRGGLRAPGPALPVQSRPLRALPAPLSPWAQKAGARRAERPGCGASPGGQRGPLPSARCRPSPVPADGGGFGGGRALSASPRSSRSPRMRPRGRALRAAAGGCGPGLAAPLRPPGTQGEAAGRPPMGGSLREALPRGLLVAASPGASSSWR